MLAAERRRSRSCASRVIVARRPKVAHRFLLALCAHHDHLLTFVSSNVRRRFAVRSASAFPRSRGARHQRPPVEQIALRSFCERLVIYVGRLRITTSVRVTSSCHPTLRIDLREQVPSCARSVARFRSVPDALRIDPGTRPFTRCSSRRELRLDLTYDV